MRVQLIAKAGPSMTGTSRYTTDLYRALQTTGVDVQLTFPTSAPIPRPVRRGLKRLGLDTEAFFASYPLRARLDRVDIYHLTTQTLATLLLFHRFPRPVVVTVLDIIPYLVRHDPELNTFRHPVDYLFYRLALVGLRRADALIAISEYTKRTLVEALGLSPEHIHIVYPAVDHERFRPMEVPDAFRARYGLDKERRYILYVGSDDPRKNLKTLIRAFALVKQQVGEVKLLKVGAPHFMRERQRLLALIAELGLEQDVLFFDEVPDEDLPLFYNVADVFVMPSLYEGFGLPVLEAMACGVLVIVASMASLPEVVGDAGIVVNPIDVEELSGQICRVLLNGDIYKDLSRAGREHAQMFRLSCQAEATESVYTKIEGVI